MLKFKISKKPKPQVEEQYVPIPHSWDDPLRWRITIPRESPLFLSSDDPIERATSPAEENSSPPRLNSGRGRTIPPRELLEENEESDESSIDWLVAKNSKGKGAF